MEVVGNLEAQVSESVSSAGKPAFWFHVERGPHAGARMRLLPGDYTLGPELGCDIVLQEEVLHRGSLKVTVSEDKAVLRSAGKADFLVDGRKSRAPVSLTTGATVQIGATTFSLIRSVNQPEKVAVHEPMSRNFLPWLLRRRPQDLGRGIFLLAGALFVSLSLVMAVYILFAITKDTSGSSLERYRKKVEKILWELRAPPLAFKATGDSIGLWGYVSTVGMRDRILRKMKMKAPQVPFHVHAEDALRHTLAKVLEVNEIPFSWKYLDNGRVSIWGILDDSAEKNRLYDLLQRSVPGLRIAEYRVYAYHPLADSLLLRLNLHGLLGQVAFFDRAGHLHARLHPALAGDSLSLHWERLRVYVSDSLGLMLSESWGNDIPRAFFKSTPKPGALDFARVAALRGGSFYLELPDGGRLFPGAQLQNAEVVMDIRSGWSLTRVSEKKIQYFYPPEE